MAYTTIDDGSAYFHAQLFTGNDATDRAITNDANAGDFKPDWLWLKNRDSASTNMTFDSSRLTSSEATLSLRANATNAEADKVDVFGGFETDGFTVDGSDSDTNSNGHKFVAWQWKANGGTQTHSQSESGSNIACSVQANTTAKFSIITYTGTGGAGHTFLHGLGSTPKVILIKIRTGADRGWIVYHHKSHATPHENFTLLNTAAAVADLDRFDDTAPNSTEIAVSDDTHVNADGNTYVAYAFDEVKGYSKFGSYIGNGNADGAFVYTGFKPAFVIQKQTSADGEYWMMKDSAREPHNQADVNFYPNANNVEGDTNGIDFLSNGFKCRTTGAGSNASDATYIYMAWAESPFVSSEGVPTTAR